MTIAPAFKKILCALLYLAIAFSPMFSAASEIKLASKETALLKKNFYLLYVLNQEQTVAQNQVLQQLATARSTKLATAIGNCQTNGCLITALQLSPTEINEIGSALISFAEHNKAVITNLRASKANINFDTGNDAELIKKSWEACALAMNRILAVYVAGEKPIYPKIDAGDFKPDDEVYFNNIKQMLAKNVNQRNNLPYDQLMVASLKILLMNGRDEAIRYEPLEKGWNKDAVKQIAKTDWMKFQYSAILVPGLGPEEVGLKLDPNGAKRCDSAAKRYFAGLAPFIVVSGGHVHPNKTPFAEAIEMKKYMIEVLKVPSNAILIEPHARHTTTNLRNINRMIYRFKIPAQKKILIVTDASQSAYILGNMANNAKRELGYVPYTDIKKLSAIETEYLPNEASLQINPFDPLDPK